MAGVGVGGSVVAFDGVVLVAVVLLVAIVFDVSGNVRDDDMASDARRPVLPAVIKRGLL